MKHFGAATVDYKVCSVSGGCVNALCDNIVSRKRKMQQ